MDSYYYDLFADEYVVCFGEGVEYRFVDWMSAEIFAKYRKNHS
jgi:hypothetical protein